MDEVIIRRIDTNTDEYAQEIALRDKVLRIPFGLSITNDDLSGELGDFHFGAFCRGILIGVLILTPIETQAVKMRQVGVEEAYRSRRIGSSLVTHAEEFAKSRGMKRIELHARKPVVPFYEKLGYTKTGPEFIEVTMLHQSMLKELNMFDA
jgi:GNAT superfamily N-acetyltransferase